MPLSQEQEDRIDAFIESYNAIEKHLEEVVKRERYTGFTSLVRDYQKQYGSWDDAQSVLEMARLRNVIVHNLTEPYEFLSVPTEETLNKLETIRDHLINPILAAQIFSKSVVTVSCSDSFSSLLKLIKKTKHTRYPVYDKNRFCGLITENSIAHWLARHVQYHQGDVSVKDETIETVLQVNKNRINYKFISKDTRIDEARMLFLDNSRLEALLMTETAKVQQRLQGIATRWDVLRLNEIP